MKRNHAQTILSTALPGKLELNTIIRYLSACKVDLLHNHPKGKSLPNKTVLTFNLGCLVSSEDPSHKYFCKVETSYSRHRGWQSNKLTGVLFPYGLQKTCRKDWVFKWPFPFSNCHGASVFCSTPPWNVLCNLSIVRGVCDENMLKSSEKHGNKRDLFLHVGLPGRLPDCHLDRWKSLAEVRAESSGWEVGLPCLRRGALTEH